MPRAPLTVPAIVRFWIPLAGTWLMMAVEGPLLRWVATHRCHHQHSDQNEDPHSPNHFGGGVFGLDPVFSVHEFGAREGLFKIHNIVPGRYIVFGFVGGVPKIPANRLLVKHRSAMGSSLRYFRWYAPEKLRTSVEELVGWYGAGKLHPLVSKRYPLVDFASAMNELTERRAKGRVVITVN